MANTPEAPRRTIGVKAITAEACEGRDDGHPGEVVLRLGSGSDEVVSGLRRICGILEEIADELKALRKQGGREAKQAYSVKEAAQLLGRSEQTIRRWIREGKLETTKSADNQQGRHLVPHSSVAQYLG
jgi:excisionase family DNA binding protein